MSKALISSELAAAIDILFDDRAMALDLLASEEKADSSRPGETHLNTSIIARTQQLRKKLEAHIIQMASEASELGCPETTDTLRMQAIGILLSLGDLRNIIPECLEFI